MTREEFSEIMLRLKRGDNTALASLHPFQDSCIRNLVIKSSGKCDPDTAYDLFIDSMLDFRKNVLHDKVAFQNIPAYINRICWNKWLETHRKKTRQEKANQMSQMHYQAGMENPELTTSVEELHNERLAQIEAGMQHLSEQCRKVLYMAIADGRSMADIAGQLGMASADVAKTTKSRCYKRLLEYIRNNT